MESKITLAVGGIAVVLISVACSLGFFGYLGVQTTMLTIEVIPFLVLAVGVDNIFMLVHTFQRLSAAASAADTPADTIGAALASVGPSILLTSASECCCFGIGALSDMPAVRTFALYACVAILLDFLLQITAFVALLAIDQRRYADGRLDVLCCFDLRTSAGGAARQKRWDAPDDDGGGFVQRTFERWYTPAVLSQWVRPAVLIAFIVVTCLSVMVIPSIEPGLDQKLSMASDSYVVKYFEFMEDLLSMGAPVYWVVGAGLEYNRTEHQDVMCGGTRCRDDSIPTQVYLAAQHAEM